MNSHTIRLLIEIERARDAIEDGSLKELVKEAETLCIYPVSASGSTLDMVKNYGARWFEYREPLNCQHCGEDLCDRVSGPPFKKEIGLYDLTLDRCVQMVCPKCEKPL